MYRATSLQLGVAGLQPIEGVDGIENLDLSKDVAGHLRYPDLIAQVLTKCGFPDVKDGEGEIERDEDIERAKQAQPDDMPEEARAIQGEKPKTGGGGGGGGEQDAEEDEASPPLPPRREADTGAGGATSPPPWASDRKEDPLNLGALGTKHVEPLAEQDLPERPKP
ncbi:hypothetical protein HYQ46_010524 [Verticillium longisporum]|nr:hypothetical protein HYQ46_010524 [Verticillium longisporum]